MERFAYWIISGDRSRDLESLLSRDLQKRFLRKQFVGNGVEIRYNIRHIYHIRYRISSSETDIHLNADEVDIARPIYEKIKRWISGIQKHDLINEYCPDKSLNKNLLFHSIK